MPEEEPEGLLLIDKPKGPTSHDAVQAVKRALGAKKAGHLGTLDPAATGLLVVCINGATKIAPFMVGHDKRYRGTLTLGVETDTLDAEGKVVATKDASGVGEDDIRRAFGKFRGAIRQRPPAYSAVKKGGVALHKLARAGKKAIAPLRDVTIKELEIESIELPRVTFRALVTAGTYIRSLAHDIGAELQVGAHLESLRRLGSGPFKVEDAIGLDEIATGPGLRRAMGAIIPLANALDDAAKIIISGDAVERISHGGPITKGDFDNSYARLEGETGEIAKAIDESGRLIAIMEKAKYGHKPKDAGAEILWRPLRVWERRESK